MVRLFLSHISIHCFELFQERDENNNDPSDENRNNIKRMKLESDHQLNDPNKLHPNSHMNGQYNDNQSPSFLSNNNPSKYLSHPAQSGTLPMYEAVYPQGMNGGAPPPGYPVAQSMQYFSFCFIFVKSVNGSVV